jgi:hypothetical protein
MKPHDAAQDRRLAKLARLVDQRPTHDLATLDREITGAVERYKAAMAHPKARSMGSRLAKISALAAQLRTALGDPEAQLVLDHMGEHDLASLAERIASVRTAAERAQDDRSWARREKLGEALVQEIAALGAPLGLSDRLMNVGGGKGGPMVDFVTAVLAVYGVEGIGSPNTVASYIQRGRPPRR